SPVGPYFPTGLKPVSIWVSEYYVRAAPGGTGTAKCGGNYAASLAPMAEGLEQGCDQVVFLDAVERRWVEELGGMNLFFVYKDGTIVTPELTGTILEGVTRSSIIELARERGHTVVERRYALEEWKRDAESGDLAEVFACGTAAVITPVGTLVWRTGRVEVGDGAWARSPQACARPSSTSSTAGWRTPAAGSTGSPEAGGARPLPGRLPRTRPRRRCRGGHRHRPAHRQPRDGTARRRRRGSARRRRRDAAQIG